MQNTDARPSAAEQLDALLLKLGGLPEAARAEIDAEIATATGYMRWVPNPGPQTDAYYCTADQLLFGGQAGGGKALALDTPLPTPTGWTTMGAVKIGDLLFAADGSQTRVTAVSPVMVGRQCYRVRFSDDAELVADADHRWFTMTDAERDRQMRASESWRAARRTNRARRGKGKRPDLVTRNTEWAWLKVAVPDGGVRTTAEIANTLLAKGRRANHAVPLTQPIILDDCADLPVDPYILGAWLGDGSSYKGEITTQDEEVLAAFHTAGYETKARTAITHGVYALVSDLKAMNLIANKHIPEIYQRGSVAQRLALLQGLMDTDGYADLRGQCEYTTTRESLAFGAQELLCSLGIKTTISIGRATLNGKDCGVKYRLKFVTGLPAFRLTRKLQRQKRDGLRLTTGRRYIVAVDAVQSVPVKCVAVDHPKRLYLAGRQFVPTHNTDVLLGLASQEHKRSLILRRLNAEVDYLAERLEEIVGHDRGLNKQKMRWQMSAGRLVQFGGCQFPGDERKYKGQPKDFIGVDEATEFHESMIEYVIGWLRSSDPNQHCRLVLATNPPTTAEGEFVLRWFAPWLDPRHPLFPCPAGKLLYFKRRRDNDGEFDFFEQEPEPDMLNGKPVRALTRTFIPSGLRDNPDYDRTDYAARLALMPEALRRRYAEGDFTASLTDQPMQVIPTAWIIAAQARWKADGARDTPMTAMGFDPAGGGRDDAVLAFRHGGWYAPILAEKGPQTADGSWSAALVVRHRRNNAPVIVDAGGGAGHGYGGTTIMRLKDNFGHDQSRTAVRPFNGAGDSTARSRDGQFRFRNKRAEAHWKFREALDPDQPGGSPVELPPDPELRADLAAPSFEVGAHGIQVEDKKAIKARIGRSPGRGDAVVMAWSEGDAAIRRSLTGAGGLADQPKFANVGHAQWKRRR